MLSHSTTGRCQGWRRSAIVIAVHLDGAGAMIAGSPQCKQDRPGLLVAPLKICAYLYLRAEGMELRRLSHVPPMKLPNF